MVGRRSDNRECDYGSRRPLVPCSLFDCALHQLCSPGGRFWCGGTINTSRAVIGSSLVLTDGHSTIRGICSDHCDLCWLWHISSLSWPQYSLLPHIRVGFLLIPFRTVSIPLLQKSSLLFCALSRSSQSCRGLVPWICSLSSRHILWTTGPS